jgi:hypothetical protein
MRTKRAGVRMGALAVMVRALRGRRRSAVRSLLVFEKDV